MANLGASPIAWATLLAHWLDFARASTAIPSDADGDRWRASVASVVNLQAVTFALAELDRVPAVDRSLARDKAEMLIRESAATLDRVWGGVPMPETLLEICADARVAHVASAYAGAVELVWEGGPAGSILVMPGVTIGEARGTLAVAQPGTLVMPGEPLAWWVNRDGATIVAAVPDATARACRLPRQVYRQIDEQGRIVRDVIMDITADPAPGLPLLVPLLEDGREIGRFTLDAATWERQQRAAMAGDLIPVTTAG